MKYVPTVGSYTGFTPRHNLETTRRKPYEAWGPLRTVIKGPTVGPCQKRKNCSLIFYEETP